MAEIHRKKTQIVPRMTTFKRSNPESFTKKLKKGINTTGKGIYNAATSPTAKNLGTGLKHFLEGWAKQSERALTDVPQKKVKR